MKRIAPKTALFFATILIVLLALPITALADAGTNENEFSQTIDGYQVTLSFEKPAFVGINNIFVLVKDELGMPVAQADLEVSVVEAEDEHVEEEAEHVEVEDEHVEAEDEHAEEQPTAEAETMSGMSNMASQPTAEAETMSGMAPADESEIAVVTEEPAEHDQMGMVALAAGHESGEYEGAIAIEADGDQIIRIHLTVNGKLMEVDFPLHVEKSNNGTVILGSFFAVNFALIAAAFVLKRKPVSIDSSKKA